MNLIQPVKVELKPGEIKRLSSDLLIEKTPDGKIILYEVEP